MVSTRDLLSTATNEALPVRERLTAVQQLIRQVPGLADDPVVAELAGGLAGLQESNPLEFFVPHSDAQREFLEAGRADEMHVRKVAAFAGNRFGKTTSLVIRALTECLDRDLLPDWLAGCKRYDAPVDGWIVVPTTDKMYDSLIPAIKKWCPAEALKEGQWAGSWSKERRELSFKNGSKLAFKTYEQDASTLGGASLHFVGYDEPPPLAHREECWTRLADHRGVELYAMTPLKTNTGWIRRKIYKNREAPDTKVVRGSMHDNTTISRESIAETLAEYSSDLWRRAREHGDFVDIGGAIYPDWGRCVAKNPWSPEFIRTLDVVVGIDPGIRNCGIVWVGFDSEMVAHVFYELLLQNKVAADYATAIRDVNDRLGLRQVAYVVDPAAKQRAQANGMTVLAAINQAGIYPNLGQNSHELGFGQMRARMQHERFKVSPDCHGLNDEADDYAAKEPGEFDDDSHLEPISNQFHRMDALRYAVLERFWDPVMEANAPNRNLGFEPGMVPAVSRLIGPSEDPAPMGFMS